MCYADVSLRSEKNVKPLSLKTERLQKTGKEPVFRAVWEEIVIGLEDV